MAKSKKKNDDIITEEELKELKETVSELEQKGLIINPTVDNEFVSFKLDKEKCLEYLLSYPYVPILKQAYMTMFKQGNFTDAEDIKEQLNMMLAINMYLFEKNNRNVVNTVCVFHKNVTIPQEELFYNYQTIKEMYDINHPISFEEYPDICFFHVKQELKDKLQRK